MVNSQEHKSASEITLEESCTLRLEAMYGTTPELAGATTVRLGDRYIHDTYLQVEPDWGTYRHLKKGQRVLVLVHRYQEVEPIISPDTYLESEPVTGPDALIVLNERVKTLPDILRRTGSDASRFTPSDLAVLKAASLMFYNEVSMIAELMAESKQEYAAYLNKLVGVCVALVFATILGANCYRRQ